VWWKLPFERLLGRLCVLVTAVVALAAALLPVSVVVAPAADAATQETAEIGAPFGGKWAYNTFVNPPYTDQNSSHPAVHLISGGGDFATDYYGTSGQPVKLHVNNASGSVTFSWASSSTSCGTSTRVNVFVDGQLVGWIYIAHLVGAVTTGPISNGMVLGTVGNYSCAPGQHVHIEVKADTGNYACYQDYGQPGTTIGENVKFAGIGATGATGIRQACTAPQPPPASRASLIKGGGFESGGWSAMPGTNFVTYSAGQVAAAEVPRSGSKYAAFNTSTEGGGIYQDVAASIGVGDTYCASSFVRSQSGGMAASGGFTIWLIGGSYNENGQQAYSGLGTLNNWTPLSTCVTATTAHSAIRVQFYATPGVGTTEADDINLSRSLVQGGGFESGGWSAMPGTNFVTYSAGQVAAAEVPRSGSKYAAFNTSTEGGGIYQDVAASIGVGDTYCASSFVRSQSGGMAASGGFTIWLIGGSYNENGQQAYSGLGTLNNWTPLSTCVTATTAHSAIRVQFYATPGVGTTEADDISAYVTSSVHGVASQMPPRVSGTPRVGTALTATGDSWYPAAVTRRYQWFVNGVQIPGAASSTFVPDASVLGRLLAVRVTASKAGYAPAQTTSAQVGAVLAGIIRNITSPSIAGRARVGQTLSANAGSWSPGGAAFRYQWMRDGKPMAGATGRKFKLRKASKGHRISVRVTVVRSGYTTTSKTSPGTRRVR
jgi:hypothetical protein